MIDIHSHILYGVDDGPKTLERSLEMLDYAHKDKITTLFATSHFKPGLESDFSARYEELKPRAAERGIELILGTEIDYVHLANTRPLLTLGGSKFILVDMRQPYLEMSCSHVLYQLSLDGYTVIIAHPERLFMSPDLKIVHELAEMDCFFQLNASSIVGRHGGQAQHIAFSIIKAGLAHYVGSDAHSPRRNFAMSEARELVNKKFGGEVTELLFEVNAQQLLKNEAPYLVTPPKRKWYQIFKR